MKLALVQYCHHGFAIKVANTVDELLQLDFEFDVRSSAARIHKVSDESCLDETGTALSLEVEQQTKQRKFKVLRLP